ncbi:carbohydrate ABC transporter permease [Caproiciproducens sp. LBM24188]
MSDLPNANESRIASAGAVKSGKGKLIAARIGCYIVLILLCFLCLFFFYILIVNSSRNNFQIQQGFSFLPGESFSVNLNNLLNNANIPVLSGIYNSFVVSAMCALLSTYFSTMTAYGIYAYDFKFRKVIFTIILLIMTMPTQVTALGFVNQVQGMGLKNSLIPLFLPSIAAPVVFFFMKQYLDSNMPMEIVEAARIDGSGEFSTFNFIVLPIMKPAIAVQAIFSFVGAWNNFFVPALLLDKANKKTLPILIAQLRSADFLKFDLGQVYMLITIAIVPVIIIYLILSKYIVRGVALGGVKG